MKRLRIAMLALLVSTPAFAESADTRAKFAYLVDDDTGSVLLNKNGDQKMVPSSMTKLMTMYVLDSRLRDGKIKLGDTMPVSEKAWRMQGSKMFVPLGEHVPVEDLVRGIIIQSGNDACIVVAEGLSGSEEAFAGEMNATAQKMGLTGSHFTNSTGWPDDNHYMTAHDLAVLAHHVIHDFPDSYKYYAEKTFSYNKITQYNRNRLLGNDIGVDGLKTGHTDEGGYGITLSAKDPASGRRLILVINGLASDNERMEEGDQLLRWALHTFADYTILKKDVPVDEAKVWFGTKDTVPLVSENDITITLPVDAQGQAKFTLLYDGPLPAPVARGAHVADLVVAVPGQDKQVIPLTAGEEVPKLTGLRKVWATLKTMALDRGKKAAPQ